MKRSRKKSIKPGRRVAVAFLLLGSIAGLLLLVLFMWPRPNVATVIGTERPGHRLDYDPESGSEFILGRRTEAGDDEIMVGPDAIEKRPGKIALIIDDAGNDLGALDAFLRFPGRLSVAVLPQLPHSEASARRVQASGREVLLHLPLEPLGEENPGPGAVLVSFDRETIRRILDQDFSTVPFARGVNNHMGSLATQDKALMDALFSYLKEKGKYFIDSRTVASTLGKEFAVRFQVPWAERNAFLDNRPEKESILRALNEGVTTARLRGRAILIGHLQNRPVLDVLLEQYEGLTASGVEFITVSEYLKETEGAP